MNSVIIFKNLYNNLLRKYYLSQFNPGTSCLFVCIFINSTTEVYDNIYRNNRYKYREERHFSADVYINSIK